MRAESALGSGPADAQCARAHGTLLKERGGEAALLESGQGARGVVTENDNGIGEVEFKGGSLEGRDSWSKRVFTTTLAPEPSKFPARSESLPAVSASASWPWQRLAGGP